MENASEASSPSANSNAMGPRDALMSASPSTPDSSRTPALSPSLWKTPSGEGIAGCHYHPSGHSKTRTSVRYMPDGSKIVTEKVTDESGTVTMKTTTYPATSTASSIPSAAAFSGATSEGGAVGNSLDDNQKLGATKNIDILPCHFSEAIRKEGGRHETLGVAHPETLFPASPMFLEKNTFPNEEKIANGGTLEKVRVTRRGKDIGMVNYLNPAAVPLTPTCEEHGRSSELIVGEGLKASAGVTAMKVPRSVFGHSSLKMAENPGPEVVDPGMPNYPPLERGQMMVGAPVPYKNDSDCCLGQPCHGSVPETISALGPPPTMIDTSHAAFVHAPHLSDRPGFVLSAPQSGPGMGTGKPSASFPVAGFDEGSTSPRPGGGDRRTPEAETTTEVVRGSYLVPEQGTGEVPHSREDLLVEEQEQAVLPGFIVEESIAPERNGRVGSGQQAQRIRDRIIDRAPLVEGVALGAPKGEEHRQKSKKWKKLRDHPKSIAIAAVCAVVVAIAVTLGVVLTKKAENLPTESPSDEFSDFTPTRATNPPRTARYNEIRSALEHVSNKEALDESSSPQHRALIWLADEDALAVDPTDRNHLKQRFALSTFYFATKGDSWHKKGNFMSAQHECMWNEDVPEGRYGVPFLGVVCPEGSHIVQNMSLRE
mmetsp:Transcript_31919/g.95557  ORF Transcript_31919/g.95557 Transcript_31919/m.95557 type:complete len:654 (-) Transcript_31919:1333-3294(-)